MRLNRLRSLSLVTVATLALTAVASDLKGLILDKSTGDPMSEATVRLLATPDSSFVKGVIADVDGRYTFTGVKKGRYIVEASYIGYSKGYLDVNVDAGKVTADTLYMSDSSIKLQEAVVTAIKTPIKVMEDTIEFNADSYKTQPNAVVEDLLKRLPGVEVDNDGKITANGKSVTKILIDGKEFFSDDPKVASKNLPVNMVDKLQVVDRKSDLARLTGVDDGEEETVINLTVKPGMKNGWFGTVEAGYGTDDRYQATFNVNRFWNDNQITFIGSANNTNDLGFTDGNGNRFRRFGGDQGINNSQSFGVNFNVGNAEIFRVGGDVMYSHTDRNTNKRQNREYLLNADDYFSNSVSRANDKGHNVRADFRIQWKPDSFNTLDIRPNMSININDSESDEFSVTRPNKNTTTSLNLGSSHGKSYEAGFMTIYNHNFKEHRGRSFSIFGRYNMSNVREHSDSYSYNWYRILQEAKLEDELEDTYGDTYDVYDRYTDNHTWSNSVNGRVSWTEPLGNPVNGNFITVAYGMQYRWNNADKLVYNRPVIGFDDEAQMVDPALAIGYRTYDLNGTPYDVPMFGIDPDGSELDNSLSNRFRNDFFSQNIRVGYKKVTRDINFEGGLSAVPSMSKSINLINSAKNIPERWVWNYAPFMRFRYKISKTASFNADYRGRSSQPSMAQLQPVADETDPMNIVQGNPDLLPSFTHNLNLRYQNFNQERQQSIMAMAFINYTQNSIVSKTNYNTTTGGKYTTYENVNGVWSARVMNMFSTPLRNKAFTFNNHMFINYNQTVGFNNDLKNTSRTIMFADMMSLAWRPDNVSLELRPNYRLQRTFNTLTTNTNGNMTVHNYGGNFDAYYYTPIDIILNSELNYSATAGYSAGYNTKTWMWNASISYQFLRGKAATLQLKVYDLLRQKQQIQRNITANYIDDTEYNTLTRYFMLTFTYKFNTFGKGNEPASREGGRRWGGPGGPPPGGGRPGGPR
ncbi:MAG: outer membrane beta-barrel protein [Muribaculaceae bacterium]|nr:outer membrane beta-barrel protein [Muribaculaceae bacterium]